MSQQAANVNLFGPDPLSGWSCAPCHSRTIVRGDSLDELRRMSRDFRSPTSRWIGYLSYDLGRQFESFSDRPASSPLFAFAQIDDENGFVPRRHALRSAPMVSTFSRGEYEHCVARVIEYVHAGDAYQVNLSQRFTTGLSAQPIEIWERIKSSARPKYGAYLDFGDHVVISSSPELFFRVDRDRRITCRPIKGTRPLGGGMEQALRESSKDQAELAMIVDLVRNDLGRVCEIGSVRVTEPRVIEQHATVLHGVATIEGRLRDGVDFVDVLRATFPCGSVTGAPKIRAMQIIDELEPVARGPYCGAIGYLSADGSMEFNVAIRTMIAQDGLIHIPVGGGIVADSNPADEYEETLVKARAMFQALGVGPN